MIAVQSNIIENESHDATAKCEMILRIQTLHSIFPCHRVLGNRVLFSFSLLDSDFLYPSHETYIIFF